MPEIIGSYYGNLQKILDKYELQDKPQFVYNEWDWYPTRAQTAKGVIATVNSKPHAIPSPISTATTVIVCPNAVENAIPPYFVFKEKRFNPNLLKGARPGQREMSDAG